MELPLFYTPQLQDGYLQADESRHIVKVLRFSPGDSILLTDGLGNYCEAVLKETSPARVTFTTSEISLASSRPYRVSLGIAPTRQPERNEWMLEKLVELGVDAVYFMRTSHTPDKSFDRVVNRERIHRIAVAAMKQSRQFFLPELHFGWTFNQIVEKLHHKDRFIAYVPEKMNVPHLCLAARDATDSLLLIGPEGDFTPEETGLAVENGFRLISLGATRLRTETAAISGCHALHLANLK